MDNNGYGVVVSSSMHYEPCMGEKCGKWNICAGAKLEDSYPELVAAAQVLLAGAVHLRRNVRGPVEWLDEYRVDARYIERLRKAVGFDV